MNYFYQKEVGHHGMKVNCVLLGFEVAVSEISRRKQQNVRSNI
jgi:hypothetical protein